MAEFRDIGPRMGAYETAIQEFRKAHDDELKRVDDRLCSMISEAKEAFDVNDPDYRLECLKLSQGDIATAARMFAFVKGGDK